MQRRYNFFNPALPLRPGETRVRARGDIGVCYPIGPIAPGLFRGVAVPAGFNAPIVWCSKDDRPRRVFTDERGLRGTEVAE